MKFCKNISELKDFLAFVVLYGPDDFPSWREMDMNKAFIQIKSSLETSKDEIQSVDVFNTVTAMLVESQKSYAIGDAVKGAHLLQDVTSLL